MNAAGERSGYPSAQADADARALVGERVRAGTGVCVQERKLDRLAHWVAERTRALALPGIESYLVVLGEDSPTGRRGSPDGTC